MGGSSSSEEQGGDKCRYYEYLPLECLGLGSNLLRSGGGDYDTDAVSNSKVLLQEVWKSKKIKLEQSIRSATSAPACVLTFSSPSACATTFSSPSVGMPIPLVMFDTPGTRTIQLSRQPMTTISPETNNIPSYWESCKWSDLKLTRMGLRNEGKTKIINVCEWMNFTIATIIF